MSVSYWQESRKCPHDISTLTSSCLQLIISRDTFLVPKIRIYERERAQLSEQRRLRTCSAWDVSGWVKYQQKSFSQPSSQQRYSISLKLQQPYEFKSSPSSRTGDLEGGKVCYTAPLEYRCHSHKNKMLVLICIWWPFTIKRNNHLS